jgi:hypothetical protein
MYLLVVYRIQTCQRYKNRKYCIWQKNDLLDAEGKMEQCNDCKNYRPDKYKVLGYDKETIIRD